MPIIAGTLVSDSGAIQAEAVGSAPSDAVSIAGTAHSSTGTMYVTEVFPGTPVYIHGIAHRDDGVLVVSNSAPDTFVDGLPVTNDGRLCYSDFVTGGSFKGGIQFAANGSLFMQGVDPAALEALNVNEGTGLEAVRVDEGTGFESLEVYA